MSEVLYYFVKSVIGSNIHDIEMGPFKCYVTQIGVGGCELFQKKVLRCKFQRYYHYEGVGGGSNFPEKSIT